MLAGLEQTAVPALRWYGMDSSLLIGIGQSLDEIDAAACTQAGVPIHRRMSGGGAVFADEGLVLLDLALPQDHRLMSSDVTEAYHWIGEVWTAALRNLGLAARPISTAEARADAQRLNPPLQYVCFGGLSPYEALVGQRKIVGLAQVRKLAGTLFQCGAYLRWDPWRTAALIAAPLPDRVALADQLAGRVAALDNLLGQVIGRERIIEHFEAALERTANLVPLDDDWNGVERAAREVALSRYAAITPPAPDSPDEDRN